MLGALTQGRINALKLMREMSVISGLYQIDGAGKEQVRVFAYPDRFGSDREDNFRNPKLLTPCRTKLRRPRPARLAKDERTLSGYYNGAVAGEPPRLRRHVRAD
jgi:hypothetical protein